MKNFATQMEAAKKGIITTQMQKVAAKEHLSAEKIRELVAKGQVVICAVRSMNKALLGEQIDIL